MPTPAADKTFCLAVFKQTECPQRKSCARYIYNYTKCPDSTAWYMIYAPFRVTSENITICELFIPID